MLLLTVERLLKLKANDIRAAVASLIGSLGSLSVFLNISGFLLSFLIKAVVTVTLVLIAFGYNGKKEFIKTNLTLIGVSAIFSGLMILIYQLFRPPNMLIINDYVYFEFDPLVMILLTVVIYIAVYLVEKLLSQRLSSTIVRLELRIRGQNCRCMAKIDTGCSLYEPFSGAPVIIIDASVMDITKSSDTRIIPYSTISGSSFLFGAKAQSTSINDRIINKDIYVASSSINTESYKAIINPQIIG